MALVDGATEESLGWIIFAVVSFAILRKILSSKRKRFEPSVRKVVTYIVMLAAWGFVGYMVALPEISRDGAYLMHLLLLVVGAVCVALIIRRLLKETRSRDRIIGAGIFSLVYFSTFALFGSFDVVYGYSTLMGSLLGAILGALIASFEQLKFEEEEQQQPGEEDDNNWSLGDKL